MREFEELFILRKREVEKHLTFVRELHEAALSRSRGSIVDTEQINILKSAFLVHLYNVVESVLTKVIDEVAATTKNHQPHAWTDSVFLAWLRHRVAIDVEMKQSDRVDRMVNVIAEAAGRKQLGSTLIARPEGNWSNKEIETFAASLACQLILRDDVNQKACVRHFVNDMPPIKYVRHMRNQLAHGNLSFVDAAASLSVEQLEFLRAAVIDYMEDVVGSFTSYLENGQFLRQSAA
jgi:MAE_28990/MAE_18760-like HEPN